MLLKDVDKCNKRTFIDNNKATMRNWDNREHLPLKERSPINSSPITMADWLAK